jgi:histone deacetylase 1/2
MTHLHRSKTISYNKEGSHLCHACQLVKHVRLPLFRSQTSSSRPFVLLHCDLWTSPIPSSSGFLYYLIIVDEYSHFFRSFPLRRKSDIYPTFTAFHAYARIQFDLPIMSIQCENGREFDNTKVDAFCSLHGILLRFSCPYTSSQNSVAERAICTTNHVI